MYEEKRLKAVYDWALKFIENHEMYEASTALRHLASGRRYYSRGNDAVPTSISFGSSELVVEFGLLSWEQIDVGIWVLCESHRNAVWAAIDSWENKKSKP